MNIKQRHMIKSTEIKELIDDLLGQFDKSVIDKVIPKKAQIEMILTEEGDHLYAVNNKLTFWKSKEGYIPILTLLLENKIDLKKVIVDMGAVKFVTVNKADIMRPGIKYIDPEIKKDEIIKIVDETHNRPLAVGRAMFDGTEMQKKKDGKVIKNLHSIGRDSVWEFAKNFK